MRLTSGGGVGKWKQKEARRKDPQWNFSEIYTQKHTHRTRSFIKSSLGFSWNFHALFRVTEAHRLPSERTILMQSGQTWDHPSPTPTHHPGNYSLLALKQNCIIASDGPDKNLLSQCNFQGERSADKRKQVPLEGSDLPKPIWFEILLALRTSRSLPTTQAHRWWLQKRMEVLISSICIFFLFNLKTQCWFSSCFLDAWMFTSLWFFFSFLITRVIDICSTDNWSSTAKYEKDLKIIPWWVHGISALVYFCVHLKFSMSLRQKKGKKETTHPGPCICVVLCVANASCIVKRWCCLQNQKFLLSDRVTPHASGPRRFNVMCPVWIFYKTHGW